ncbi:MAG: sulfite exporter TauE/SafE family protein [Alphaproteobacteria bacterium]|jgi:uncharacterized membrane protein YfcA
MILYGITYWHFAAIIGAFVASGLVRGFNGGAGANFITAPVLALLIGPREGVPIIILLNLISNVQVMPSALPHADWKRMLPVGLASMAMAPLGAYILLTVEEDTMRRIVAGTSILLSLLLLTGWRYCGPRGLPVRIGVGGLAGLVTGSVSMGGPPVFLYLLSGPGTAAEQRANFLAFGAMVQTGAVITFIVGGLISVKTLVLAAVLFVPFMLACWVGTRLFAHASDAQFRNLTLWGIAVLSLIIAVA